MPPRSPEPLRRITLNLFEADCAAMERRYGHGWTEQLRNMVRSHLNKLKQPTIDEITSIYTDELEDDHG